MSRRSLTRLSIFGLIAGLLLGALVYLPRVNGYQSVVPQHDTSQLQSGGRQVPNAKVGLAQTLGLGGNATAAILKR